MDRERLINLLEAVRSIRAGVFQMEQDLLSALSAEQVPAMLQRVGVVTRLMTGSPSPN